MLHNPKQVNLVVVLVCTVIYVVRNLCVLLYVLGGPIWASNYSVTVLTSENGRYHAHVLTSEYTLHSQVIYTK